MARAEARYEVMARLVTNDPCRALEAALPPEVREALPPDVVAHLAVPVSDAGVLTAASTTIRPSDIPGHRILSCRAMMGRQSYVAAICAQGAAPRLGLETSIHGLAAGEALAVLESPLLVVRDSGTAESLESLLREPAFRGFHPPPARGAKGGGLTLRWKSHTFHVPSVRFAQALEAHLLAAGGS